MLVSKEYKGIKVLKRKGEVNEIRLEEGVIGSKVRLEGEVGIEEKGKEVKVLTKRYIVSSQKAELGVLSVVGGCIITVRKGSIIYEREEGKYVEVTSKGEIRELEKQPKEMWEKSEDVKSGLGVIRLDNRVEVEEKVKGGVIENIEYIIELEESKTAGLREVRKRVKKLGLEWSKGKIKEKEDGLE